MFIKEKFDHASVYTFGLKRNTESIKYFLPEIGKIDFFAKKPKCILGWGHKQKAGFARNIARKRNIPYIALEDGFISSIGVKGETCPRSSLIIDRKGIYYDPTQPSDLELILSKKEFPKELIERAKGCIDFIKEHGITKYNSGVNLEETGFEIPVGNSILLVDQTKNDSAVTLASKGQEDFDRMFEFAREKFPEANIIIKTHPEIANGKKKGYLKKYYNKVGVFPLTDDVNIYSLLPSVDAVFTISSLTGMEALIAGIKVYCFGKPFYAGWGLTEDMRKFKTRNRKLTLEELFAGAYMVYPRYINPYNKYICELEELLTIIAEINYKNRNLKKPLYCTGFTYWKRDNVRSLLKTPYNKVRFCWNEKRAITKAKRNGGEVVVWASKESPQLAKACELNQVPLRRVEDGFIRSIDIGSNLTPSLSLVIDNSGIYYDSRKECDLERMLKSASLNQDQKERAAKLIELINENSITKYNLQTAGLKFAFPRDKKVILVPGQVEDDASVLSSNTKIKTNRKLLEEARRKEKNNFIIFKPHPDVLAGNRKGHLPKKIAMKYADIILEKTSISELVKRCDKVYTISSLVGFEALLKDKEVHCYGRPFYAGWSMTKDDSRFPERKKIDIRTLVYCTLISYPRYIDPISGVICEPELLIERIATKRKVLDKIENKSRKLRFLKFLKNLIKDIKRNF